MGVAQADIDLSLEPTASTIQVGDVFGIEVVVYSDSSFDQLMSAMQMIFAWDTPYVQLLGSHQVGAVPLLFSGFPANDPYGLNEAVPPQNGIGLYQALAPLGAPVAATPSGTLLTTLEFQALAPTNLTLIDILLSAGDPLGHTIVFDGTTPNTDVTGILTGAAITIIPAPGAAAVLLSGLLVASGRRRRETEKD